MITIIMIMNTSINTNSTTPRGPASPATPTLVRASHHLRGTGKRVVCSYVFVFFGKRASLFATQSAGFQCAGPRIRSRIVGRGRTQLWGMG